jgi:enterochelin esterase-like enzyme
MVDQYVPNLKRYRAIALDVGNMDFLGASNMQLDEELTQLGVRHTFEVYDGDHMNRVAERYLEHVLPFFSEQLERK